MVLTLALCGQALQKLEGDPPTHSPLGNYRFTELHSLV